MMKWELAELLNDLPDDIISSAFHPTHRKHHILFVISAAAACFAAVIAAAVFSRFHIQPPERITEPVGSTAHSTDAERTPVTSDTSTIPSIAETAMPFSSALQTMQTIVTTFQTAETFQSTSSTAETNGVVTIETVLSTFTTVETKAAATPETSINDEWQSEKQWDERTIDEQFLSFRKDDTEYVTRTKQIPADQIESCLYDVILNGQDYANNEMYSANAKVYQIHGIMPECAVAVRFQGYDTYYSYTNRGYFPETLGEFADALNLTKTISFGTVYRPDSTSLDTYDSAVLKNIFSERRDMKRTEDAAFHTVLFDVSVSVKLLGIENKSMQFTEDGYLKTNLMEWSYTFYIGTEKVQEIAEAIGIENAVPASTPANRDDTLIEE